MNAGRSQTHSQQQQPDSLVLMIKWIDSIPEFDQQQQG